MLFCVGIASSEKYLTFASTLQGFMLNNTRLKIFELCLLSETCRWPIVCPRCEQRADLMTLSTTSNRLNTVCGNTSARHARSTHSVTCVRIDITLPNNFIESTTVLLSGPFWAKFNHFPTSPPHDMQSHCVRSQTDVMRMTFGALVLPIVLAMSVSRPTALNV